MKTKETLYTTMCNNIGQVRIENAQKEIERLNRQYNTNSWRTDNSPFMFVEDETDDDVHNPCELIEGYVWVTCEPKVKSTREQAITWWDSIDPDLRVDFCIYYNDKLNLSGRLPSSLTGREIEEIYDKEILEPKRQEEWQESQVNRRYSTKSFRRGIVELSGEKCTVNYKFIDKDTIEMYADDLSYIGVTHYKSLVEEIISKPNQKQFKQFDESLHKAYLNKFSEEDKFKAFISNLNELTKEIQFNAFLATLKKMNLDPQTQSNIMTLVALRDI